MKSEKKFEKYDIYPCMPYAHKYANAVTEYGVLGAMNQFVPGNLFVSLVKGGISYFSKDHFALMELMIDAEMKMFKGLNVKVIFLQNIIILIKLNLNAWDHGMGTIAVFGIAMLILPPFIRPNPSLSPAAKTKPPNCGG